MRTCFLIFSTSSRRVVGCRITPLGTCHRGGFRRCGWMRVISCMNAVMAFFSLLIKIWRKMISYLTYLSKIC